MKTIVNYLFILLLILSSCSPKKTYDEFMLSEYGVLGHVKTFKQETYTASSSFGIAKKDSLIESSYCAFDKYGFLVSTDESVDYDISYNKTSSSLGFVKTHDGYELANETRFYDKKNRLVKDVVNDNLYNSLTSYINYNDSDLKSEELLYREGELFFRSVYEYNNKKQLVNFISYFESFTKSIFVTYYKDGRPKECISKVNYEDENKESAIFKIVAEYDDENQICTLLEYESDLYDEDDDGDYDEFILRSMVKNLLIEQKEALAYFNRTYWIEEKSYYDSNIEWIAKRKIDLDDHNNVVKAVEYKNEKAISVYYADIHYYD